MAAKDNRFRPVSRRLLVGAPGMCALLALAAFAGNPARSGAQSSSAQQTTPAPALHNAAVAAQAAYDAQSFPAPAQPHATAAAQAAYDAQSFPAPAQPHATAAPTRSATQPATAAAPAPPRPPYPGMTPEEKRKEQVARQCADLLKLATDLKAQVDKARKDELSVSVVRKAAELEQMAHKVRNGAALSTSNE